MKKSKQSMTSWQCIVCGAVWSMAVKGCGICNQYAEVISQTKHTRLSNTTYDINSIIKRQIEEEKKTL